MKTYLLLLFSLVFYSGLFAQFNGPESVDYHRGSNTYFVSNTGSNNVIKINPDFSRTVLPAIGGSGPHGLEVAGDTLYACSGSRIKAYDAITDTPIFNLSIAGASFLNGITHIGNYLFVTDFSGKKIYRVNRFNQAYNIFVPATTQTPNGILYDSIDNRLVVVCWGTPARVKEVSLSDSTIADIISTPFGNIDGIAMRNNGNFLVSPWSVNGVIEYMHDFSAIADTAMYFGEMTSPADIYYNKWTDTLAVPASSIDSVFFISYYVADTTADTTIIDTSDTTSIFVTATAAPKFFVQSNRVSDLLVVLNPSQEQIGDFEIITAQGAVILRSTGKQTDGRLTISVQDLVRGNYYLRFVSFKEYKTHVIKFLKT